MKETAQVAFEAFMRSIPAGMDIPPSVRLWGAQNNETQRCWRSAAEAAIEHDHQTSPKFDPLSQGAFRRWAEGFEVQQKSILEAIKTMANTVATRDQLDAGIATLQADDVQVLALVATSGTTIGKALQDLLDKINANPGAPVSDFTAEVQALASQHADFQGAVTNLQKIVDTAQQDDPGPQTTAAVPSTLSISASPLAPDTTSTITLAGSVQAGAKVPTGSVTINDTTGAIAASATLDANGGFTTTVGPLSAGSFSLEASYGGDANSAASTQSLSITVTDATAQ